MNAPMDRGAVTGSAVRASGTISGTTTSDMPALTPEQIEHAPAPVEFTGLDRSGKLIFAGLMLGMFVASISQTIVGPALPRIVAELHGMEHYSWIATSAMLASAVAVPIVGKFSDIFGRRAFYIGGLVVFLLGSILAGASQDFWFLVFARAVQGIGMGTLMPLSQTIIGDIIPPRQRGKYQGLMGATFGISSIAGPLLGGVITDALGWRWLFYMTLPLGALALWFIIRYMHLDHRGDRSPIDYWGMATLIPGLVLALLATSWGGSQHPWTSPVILGMYAAAAALLIVFVLIELRVPSPLIPLRILANRVVAVSILASFAIAVAMFGAIIYIPVFAQASLGVSATESGAILIPLNIALVLSSIVMGLVITKIGRYKMILIGGAATMLVGYILLTLLDHQSSSWALTGAMSVIGIGLGMSMQTYMLVVQNAVAQTDLGVATSSVQFFRNVGSTVGIAVLGSVLAANTEPSIQKRIAELPAPLKEKLAESGGVPAGGESNAVLDPGALSHMPAPLVEAIQAGMGDAMHSVFMAAVPFAVLALILSLFVKQLPLRTHN